MERGSEGGTYTFIFGNKIQDIKCCLKVVALNGHHEWGAALSITFLELWTKKNLNKHNLYHKSVALTELAQCVK